MKGLEFPRVVLYGFGAACPPLLRAALEKLGSNHEANFTELTQDHAIEPQYYWNRLYVAASRPRKRLFIVDKQEDIDAFWNRVFGNQDNTILRANTVIPWEDVTGQIIQGAPEAWEGDQEDPSETAVKLEDEGRLRQDRTLLRQAAPSFRTANRPDDEKRCRAQAFDIESNHLGAAELWRDLQDYPKSVNAAWKARETGFRFILDLANHSPALRTQIHWRFASYYLNPNATLADGVEVLKAIAEGLDAPKLQEDILTSPVWPDMIHMALERLLKNNAPEKGMWEIMYRNAAKLADQGLRISRRLLGELAFKGGQLKEAFRHWEDLSAEERAKFEVRFLEAKAAALGFPLNIDAYGELLLRHSDRKFAEAILETVRREGHDRLSAAQITPLIRAHLALGDPASAFDEISRTKEMPLLVSVVEALEKKLDNQRSSTALNRIMEVLLENGDWDSAADLLMSGKTPVVTIAAVSEFAKSRPRLHSMRFMEVVASTRGLETAPNSLKTRVAEWLTRQFPNNLSWRRDLHPVIVGMAFEHLGLFWNDPES